MERNSDNYACLYCVYIDHMNECDMLFILQCISVSSIIIFYLIILLVLMLCLSCCALLNCKSFETCTVWLLFMHGNPHFPSHGKTYLS